MLYRFIKEPLDLWRMKIHRQYSSCSGVFQKIRRLDTISGTFNFVFTILFNFPSQYFSAIGLHVIFRFGRNLPPVLRTIPKVRDSKAKGDPWNQTTHYRAFTFIGSNFHWNSQVFDPHQPLAQKVHRSAPLLKHTLFLWPTPSSFATTDGISFDFFSWG